MSVFTRFDAELNISYSVEASILLQDDYWLLRQAFGYDIDFLGSNKRVEVPKGFLSDGASIPWFARGLIPRMGKHSQASFLHDYLCETYYYIVIENGIKTTVAVDRKEIDRIFIEALKVIEFPKWRIALINTSLHLYRITTRPTKPDVAPLKKELETKYSSTLLVA